MRAEIITIGDEILIGQIVDTNSAWMAEQLNLAGIEIYQITSVHDDSKHILEAIKNASEKVDMVLITGGLGPTKDDITKNVLCEYFNTKLVFHEPTLEHIRKRFKNRGIPINKLNRDQAFVPESCTVLHNAAGTAPGMWFEQDSTIYVSMPGVPFEMKYLMTNEILPRLVSTGRTTAIFHHTVLTQGIPESVLAEKLEPWEDALPKNIKLAYLPSPMAVRLRLSAKGSNAKQLKADVEAEAAKLQQIIPDAIYGFGTDTMAAAIGKLLLQQTKTLSVAESCTGGHISNLITLTPGASAWYSGGVTAYDNAVKINVLGISPATLQQFGAVSEQTAKEMALGVRKLMNSSYSVATTGIAGPDGGSEEKPVGTIWIAAAGPTKLIAEKFVFGNDRERNILRSSQTALQLLRRLILEHRG